MCTNTSKQAETHTHTKTRAHIHTHRARDGHVFAFPTGAAVAVLRHEAAANTGNASHLHLYY